MSIRDANFLPVYAYLLTFAMPPSARMHALSGERHWSMDALIVRSSVVCQTLSTNIRLVDAMLHYSPDPAADPRGGEGVMPPP